jgi:hypothetical protein
MEHVWDPLQQLSTAVSALLTLQQMMRGLLQQLMLGEKLQEFVAVLLVLLHLVVSLLVCAQLKRG